MKLILITGPTAVGKTDIAFALNSHTPIEIINADVGQFYEPLTIGTAKPDWRNHPIPHHLFDVITQPEDFTVMQFRERALTTIREIIGRGSTPVVVGGSGFYIKSLFFEPHVGSGKSERVEMTEDDVAQAYEELRRIDPTRAEQIHPRDAYRITRALDQWRQTGKLPSTLKPTFSPPAPYSCFVLTRDREELYQRINERTEIMLKAGWVEETQKLLDTPWEPFLQHKKVIGYNLIIDYLRERMTREEMVVKIKQETRNYAKRQMTFFRSMCTQLACEFVDCTSQSEAAIIREILRSSQ